MSATRETDWFMAVDSFAFALFAEFLAASNGPTPFGILFAVLGVWFLIVLFISGANLAWGYPYEDVTLEEARALEYRLKRGLP